MVPLLFLGHGVILCEETAFSLSFTQSPTESPKCKSPFSDSIQAQIEARTLSLLVVVLRDWVWFTIAKWADYKPSGAVDTPFCNPHLNRR